MLSKEQIKFFDNNGYLQIDISDLKIIDEFNNFKKKAILKLPNYDDGEEYLKIQKKKFKNPFNLNSEIKNYRINGCPLEHRITRGRGSVDSKNDINLFYGKRLVLSERFWGRDLAEFLENKNLLNAVQQILGTNEISLHNASLAASYPKNTGEDGWLHVDTPGFKSNRKEIFDKKHLLNVLIYLNDVDESLAPTRIVPGSHKKYDEINESAAQSLKQNDLSINHLTQAGGMWEEMISKELRSDKKIYGKAGTMIFMNSSLLHSATGNNTLSKTRYVMISNFSRREDKHFFKNYSKTKKSNKKFASYFKDTNLVKRSFLETIPLKSILKENLKELVNICLRTKTYFVGILKKIVKYILNYINLYNYRGKTKKYLNIGSGITWNDKNIYGLDYYAESEIQFDLNQIDKLPFNDNYMKGVYTSHCLEHLTEKMVEHWLKETHRILEQNGILRVTVPNINEYLEAYNNRDASYFNWIRGKHIYAHDSWLRMIVRAFAEPVVDNYSDEELKKIYIEKNNDEFINYFSDKVNNINDEKFLAPHAHKSGWHPDKFSKLLKDIGFKNIRIAIAKDSEILIFRGKKFDETRPHMSFIIEAKK